VSTTARSMTLMGLVMLLCCGCSLTTSRQQTQATHLEASASNQQVDERIRSLEIKVEFLESKLNDLEDQIQGEVRPAR
jgi:outer membrane biogenesis lipoprotein LolB